MHGCYHMNEAFDFLHHAKLTTRWYYCNFRDLPSALYFSANYSMQYNLASMIKI